MAETTERLKGTASDVSEKVKDAASSAKDTVQEGTGQVASRMADRAQQAREAASGRVREQVDQRSTQVGEQAAALAGALRTSADKLRDEGQQGPERMIRAAADRLEAAGGYLNAADSQRIMSDAESFARKQPWLIAAAGALVGVAAARFLKASRPPQPAAEMPTTPRSAVPGASYAPAPAASPADIRYPG